MLICIPLVEVSDTLVFLRYMLICKHSANQIIYIIFHLSVVAIKELGGPTIKWSSGRVDALDPSAVTPDGRLPNADVGPAGSDPEDAAHLRTIFNRMGFNDQEVSPIWLSHSWC